MKFILNNTESAQNYKFNEKVIIMQMFLKFIITDFFENLKE